jgi:hypothetical protein
LELISSQKCDHSTAVLIVSHRMVSKFKDTE